MISKIMLSYKDVVMRCHTDEFITLEVINYKCDNELGDLVDEGYTIKIRISSCKKAIVLIS